MKKLLFLLIILLTVPVYGVTYYVDVANGNDANDGLSEQEAFASLAKAADMVDDGDVVYVQATGSYTAQDGTNDCVLYLDDTGLSSAPITWIGYVSDVNDGGIVTIDASANSLTNVVSLPGTSYRYVFKNFRFTGASGNGVEGSDADYLVFVNCSFDNNGGKGVNLDDYNTFANCIFYDNAGTGASTNTFSRYFNCIIYNNDSEGLVIHDGTISNSLAYGNGDHAMYLLTTSPYGIYILNSTIDANSHRGIYQAATDTGWNMIVQNTIIANASTGIYSSTDYGNRIVDSHNLFYSNTSNVHKWLDPTDADASYRGSSVTATDPFTNAAAGDYSLASGSAAIEKAIWDDFNEGAGNNPPSGSSDIDIGAIQEPAGAGGAGGGKVIGKSVVQ